MVEGVERPHPVKAAPHEFWSSASMISTFSFSYFRLASLALFFFLASAASFWVAYQAAPSGPFGRCGRDL